MDPRINDMSELLEKGSKVVTTLLKMCKNVDKSLNVFNEDKL